jgi:hypothetical protein
MRKFDQANIGYLSFWQSNIIPIQSRGDLNLEPEIFNDQVIWADEDKSGLRFYHV